jgi:hypothetical protein
MEIVYLPMPVSLEEKRALNKKGFKVVDELYKPAEEAKPVEDTEKPKRGSK